MEMAVVSQTFLFKKKIKLHLGTYEIHLGYYKVAINDTFNQLMHCSLLKKLSNSEGPHFPVQLAANAGVRF
jgi:hypothetical protein